LRRFLFVKGPGDLASRVFRDRVKIEDTFFAKLEDVLGAQLGKVLDDVALLPGR
jgi:hypothetical protein